MKKITLLLLLIGTSLLGLFLTACDRQSGPSVEEARVELGKTLYFDHRLSSTGEISCNSCHNVMTSGTDNKPVSEGVHGQKGGRNSPTVFNAAFWSAQFWDGRADTLEAQAKGPLTNPIEMGMADHDAVVAVLKDIQGYLGLFESAFPEDNDPITIDNVATAIADYERTLTTLNSPWDKYQAGDKTAISEQAIRGHQAFVSSGCISCHSGPHFAGPDLPKGTAFLMKFPTYPSDYDQKYNLLADKGKFEETKNAGDKHMWRVQSLRNVAITEPYFHNGSVEQLDEAVRVMAKTQLNTTLSDDDVQDIVAFLETLTGEVAVQTKPELPQ